MGGKSGQKQTIGYKHYVGWHLVPCHGPIDKIKRLTVDQRVAWEGENTGTTITVDAPKLFGGDKREGGVSGDIDVDMGGPTQTKNDYLLAKIGPAIPAYRGVVSLIFRQCYLGNNPYLKPWAIRGQRIYVRQDGIAQWYPEKAGIGGVTNSMVGKTFSLSWWQNSWDDISLQNDPAGMYIHFMDEDGNYLESHGSLFVEYPDLWVYRTEEATAPEGTASVRIEMWLGKLVFYRADGCIDDIDLLIDGEPYAVINPGAEEGTTGWTNRELEGLELQVRNDGMPVAHGGSYYFAGEDGNGNASYYTKAYQVIGGPGDELDMNPAHIIRECLTDPDWGMGYAEADIDDTFFTPAADTLYDEGMGMSLLWDRQTTIENFISEVVRHIDAALYVSRTTGKFNLKLIRADYDPDDLITLDESNIDRIESPSRPAFGELTNSVTVNFRNTKTGKPDSVTMQDPAGVQMQGVVINTTMQYPGFTNGRNANRAAERDLRALSNPYLSCTVFAGEDAKDLDIGDCFKLSWAKWDLTQVVMRVTGIALSDGKTTGVRIKCVEDVFSTPINAVQADPAEGWEDPAGPPLPAAEQIAFEVPYYEIVQTRGQSATDSALTADPDLGYVGAAAIRGNQSTISARLWTDAGAGYAEAGSMDLSPGGILTAAIGKTATAVVLEDFEDLDLVTVGTHAQIGTGVTAEIVRVDAVNATTGAITIGRGALDTVPQLHPAGAVMVFWDEYNGHDLTEYADGETVDVKVTPLSGSGEVAIGTATEMSVELAGRAYRPYPPGDLLINGLSYTDDEVLGEIPIDWVHRDRLQQTGGVLLDHFDAGVGPEAGTLYRVQGYIDGVLVHTEDDIAGTTAVWDPAGEGLIRVEVHAKRDGVYSWQGAWHEFYNSDVRATEAGDIRATEDGFERSV